MATTAQVFSICTRDEPLAITALRVGTPESHVVRARPPQQQSILCVDADRDSHRVMRQAFPGCELVAVSSGYEALRQLNARVFDSYVLDYWLPDWSGVSLCRDIRQADPNVPVIFCTAATRSQSRKRADRAGANAYFLKPADPQLLYTEAAGLMHLRARRNDAARGQAIAAVRQEVEKRLIALPAAMPSEQLERALKRCARAKALSVFLAAGGTLAGFERVWEAVWIEAWTY